MSTEVVAAAGRTYALSLTKDYVSRWGMVEAVRELIQNALDSSAPFRYEFVREDDETQTLLLTSEGLTLPPHTLLLGATGKAHDPDAIGSFGEGYKLALLVLTRCGYDASVLNGPLEWRPRFRFSREFGVEQLVIDERPLTHLVNTGLVFRVARLTDEDVEAIRAVCLRMQRDIGQIRTTEMGDILMDRPGELYVGDLFVCRVETEYGYNVLPKHLRLERDRQTVSGWDLQCVTRDMWYATLDYDFIADMIGRNLPDVEYARYSAPTMVKEACYKHFRTNHPTEVIAETDAELKSVVAQGMRGYVAPSTYYHAVSTSPSYRAEPRAAAAPPELPVKVLERWLSENRKEMRGKAIEAFRKELINDKAIHWKAMK